MFYRQCTFQKDNFYESIFRCVLIFAAAATSAAAPLRAATIYWVNPGIAGDFNTAANWSGGVLPNAGDWMWVGAVSPQLPTATANITADYTNNATPPEYLYVGRGAGTNGTINQTAGALVLNTGLAGSRPRRRNGRLQHVRRHPHHECREQHSLLDRVGHR